MHAFLLGTFCFSKGKRSFCLSLLKLQNVPNKHAGESSLKLLKLVNEGNGFM